MKILLLIIIVLAIWIGAFFLFERILRWLHGQQKIERVKHVLFEKSDWYIITTLSGKEYVIVRNKFYRI